VVAGSLVMCSLAAAAQERDRSKIPDKYKWNLADLYPSDAAWRGSKDKATLDIAQLAVFKGVTEAMSALEGGNCVGVVFDTTFFAGIMGDAKWADYAMVVPAIDPEPWGMGVRKDDPKFAAYMSDLSKEWHKTGFILGLEKKWGIPQSPFLVEQQTKFK